MKGKPTDVIRDMQWRNEGVAGEGGRPRRSSSRARNL